ncbi:MAG TPA: oligopeptidase B, partial [Blastocatellia bacterium]
MVRLTRRMLLTLLSALLAVSCASQFSPAVLGRTGADGHPPVAKKIPHTTEIHGLTLKDDYFWLREKKNPDVIQYLESENAYTEEMMKPTRDIQDSLYKEMLGRIKQTDLSVPSRIGQYYYYQRTEEGKQYPYMCRKKAGLNGQMDGQEELLLDLNKLAEGHSFLGLGGFHVSDDGNLLAYSTDTTGYRQYNLHVKDLRTGETLSENIERVGSIVWSSDNKTLFYTTEDAVSKRSDKFWRHAVSSDKNDLIYEEKDELFDVFARRSDDKKVIFLVSAAKTSTEYRYLMADNPTGEFKVVIARRDGHEYSVEH